MLWLTSGDDPGGEGVDGQGSAGHQGEGQAQHKQAQYLPQIQTSESQNSLSLSHILAIYGPIINGYIRYGFDAGRSITRASGRGLGPGNRDFRRVPFGAKKVDISKGPIASHLPQ
jgi:hypothetical protein